MRTRSTRDEARGAWARVSAWAGACALALVVATGVGCNATPLPDPPSFDASRVTLTNDVGSGLVRIVGSAGTVTPGGTMIRLTVPPRVGVLVETRLDGSFARIIGANVGETLFVELVYPDRDEFAGAFLVMPPRLVPTDPGMDRDRDESPDVVDCLPLDPARAGGRCYPMTMPCTVDMDCVFGFGDRCIEGNCVSECLLTPETCNAMDDDCDGFVDNGEPGVGLPCGSTAPGCTPGIVVACTMGLPDCMGASGGVAEICNGVDDDCDGIVDDGCPMTCMSDADCEDGDPTTDNMCDRGMCIFPPGR